MTQKINSLFSENITNNLQTSLLYNIILARTAEIGQGLGRIPSCGARKPEQT